MYIGIQYLQEYLHICVYLMFGSRVRFGVSVNVTTITGFSYFPIYPPKSITIYEKRGILNYG